MRTEDLIVQLAGSAGPVRRLEPPLHLLARWTAGSAVLVALAAVAIGLRPGVATAVHQGSFLTLALLTMGTAVASAGAALVLAVPGAERSIAQRWLPLGLAAGCVGVLTASLAAGGSAGVRLMALPFHVACSLEITGLAVLPGWGLFRMLRAAAPLSPRWSAGLASLAALALAAAATQFICPVDDPAHLLIGHFAPVAALALAGTQFGGSALERPNERRR